MHLNHLLESLAHLQEDAADALLNADKALAEHEPRTDTHNMLMILRFSMKNFQDTAAFWRERLSK